ncbi:MAG: hypothetical protein K2N75_08745 [Helicobacter sp.]|nr:hypothetical protein [Helicobacter sp.]MDE5925173.1 hypothetical protein [Helicobacter sp.]MDE7176106.1 hypothetical protein [Helicobacter sp.]
MQFAKLEKTDKHLKQFNENLLINGTAFNLLPQKKIESWLLDLKIL